MTRKEKWRNKLLSNTIICLSYNFYKITSIYDLTIELLYNTFTRWIVWFMRKINYIIIMCLILLKDDNIIIVISARTSTADHRPPSNKTFVEKYRLRNSKARASSIEFTWILYCICSSQKFNKSSQQHKCLSGYITKQGKNDFHFFL